MNAMEVMSNFRHEKILFVNNEKAGLKAIIAVHNTNLGPAIGGCRLWPYASFDDALFDVTRLSRGMSHKNAVAGLPHGGGKGVIIADPSQKTEAMFEAFGEAVNNLGGDYITAEDVNTDTNDALVMLRKTKYLCGLPHGGGKGVIIADPSMKTEAMFEAFGEAVESLGGDYITAEDVNTTCDDALVMMRKTSHICGLPMNSGDPSPFTARGCWQGIKATAKVALGRNDLEGLTVTVQGLGKVGYDLCRYLHNDGAKLFVGNLRNKEALERARDEFGATILENDQIMTQECDILAPCALGAILNYNTIPNLNCKAVAGAANNQILDDECGRMLKARGIYYAPDFVINGGGVINAAAEVDGPYNKDEVLVKVDNIYTTIEHILSESKKTGEPEGVIATRYAESLIYR